MTAVLDSMKRRGENKFILFAAIAIVAHAALPDLSTKQFVPLQIAGLGRYGTQSAVFLEATRGGRVLPIPIPRETELAFEQALTPTPPSSTAPRPRMPT